MKRQIQARETATIPTWWIEVLAGLTGLIGVAGLIALTAQGAWAANPQDAGPRGFEPGSRTFSNPFAAQPGAPGTPPPPAGGGNFFEDEAEDEAELDFPEDSAVPGYQPQDNPTTSAATGSGGGRGFGGGGNTGSANRPSSGGNFGVASPRGGSASNNSATSGGAPAKAKPLSIDDETAEGSNEIVTDFNFPDADILDIAKTLGKLTGKNFILDKDVKGRITIISNSPITVGDAWKAFLTALDINGFALIPSGKMIRIARQRDARDKQLKTYAGDYSPDTDALITRLFPLKYLSAEEVARNFRSFMPANSRIIPYEQTNTVIVTDTGSNISKLAKLLEILDVEGYDAGIEVIPVRYASAAELSKLIDTLVPGTSAAPGAGGAPRFGGGKFNARRTKEGGIINTIIADERTNTLIVHANTKGADQVRELVAKLDQRIPAATGGGKVHVVYLQFAEAEQVAATLNNISQAPAGGGRPAGGGTGINPVQQSLFEGSIKVSPDKSTNSLVITASPGDFVTVQRVINKLDIPRDQVFAEVIIMEINLNKDFNYSSNVIAPRAGISLSPNTDILDFIQNPAAQQGAILSLASKDTVEIPIAGTKVAVKGIQGLIKAIQTNSNANILATPQVMTLDNTEATFETSEKIPVPTINTTATGIQSQSITKESVALTVTLKPQINKLSNFVKLDINAKLADISQRTVPAALQNQAFATFDRSVKTSIVVADRDTVVLGGLMRDNQSDTINKVPLLGDIPLLGWLFKAKTSKIQKSNLVMFITPQIVRQYEKVRAILDKKLKERDEFIEKSAGGDDPLRDHRERIITELPDINEVTSYKPQNYQTVDQDTPAAAVVEEEDAAKTAPGDKGAKAPSKGASSNANAGSPAPDVTTLKEPPATTANNGSEAPPVTAPVVEAPVEAQPEPQVIEDDMITGGP